MLKKIILISTVLLASISCQKKLTEEASSGKYLYVASGLCYSGNGITTFTAATASNLVYRIDTSTGKRDTIIADYYAAPANAGDTPTSIEPWNDSELMIMVRNGTTGRALETVSKTGGSRSNFGLNPGTATVLATAPASMKKTADGGLLIARTGFIEKVTSTGVRLGAPWVNSAISAPCGATNALLTTVLETGTSKIITMNAATSNARVFSVEGSGANGATGCISGVTAPVATSFPTAGAYDSVNKKLIVAYAGNSTASNINTIMAYDVNDAGTISNGQEIYDANDYPATYSYLLFGISAMDLDVANGYLYVSTAISSATTVVNYNIEKLNYNPTLIGTSNTSVLTRSSTVPFYGYGVDTKCISSMKLGN